MKIIKFVPKTNQSSNNISVTNIVKDTCGFSYENSFTMAEESFTLASPRNGINDLSTCAKIWVGIKKGNSYWSYETINENGFKNEVAEYDLSSCGINFKTDYTLDELLRTNALEYNLTINDPYNTWNLYQIKSITAPDYNNIDLKELINMIAVSVPNGTHNYKLNISFENEATKTIEIKVAVSNKKKTSNFSSEHISFTYAFFSPLYSNSVKPTCAIKCFTSKNLVLNKVEFYYEDNLLQKETNIDDIINLNINNIPSYEKDNITAKFYVLNTDTNSTEVIEDTKGILVSDKIKSELVSTYDSTEDIYKVKLIVADKDVKNIGKIIWRVSYDSMVMENIISAGTEPLKMYSSVVFEDTTDNTKLELPFDFKQKGKYIITAYVIDISGKTQIARTYVQTTKTKKEESTYTINKKVDVLIKSNDNKTPTFTLYHIKDGKLVENKVIITDKMFDNIYGSHFTIEHNDCVYIVKSSNSFKTYPVGEVSNIVVISLNPNIPKLPDYVFKDFDGNKLDSGTIKSNPEKTIGYVILPKNKSGMIKIGDSLYKKID